ncbi:cytochrome c1 heme lyase [Microthyrium microscopicum]|uniref:Holocytochrome c-type synthase n=1 Tax=Microthyrium microscopicum TaxID=703497 RepID=A0A6A6UNV7_9PEZI|nr:cytochrome c1 heme lyase [Microthyrium microscopicum]
MVQSQEAEADACPVDHKTRAAWLEKAKSAPHPLPPAPNSLPSASEGQNCDSSTMDQTTKSPTLTNLPGASKLAKDREISTIPRALPQAGVSPSQPAANSQGETGTSKSGHWIYPSERMFFDALKRKNYDANAQDMRSIVPIHNAVNEKAWQEILAWEKGRGGDSCGGPRLESFSGLSTQLTPRARFNTLMGYHAPFDRHDWVVDRCGTKVEYVIDFYSGKDDGKSGKPLNFYLDVRPKLNTVEGWKTRFGGMFGL